MDLKALSFNLDSLEVKTPQDLPKTQRPRPEYFTKVEWVSNSEMGKFDSLSKNLLIKDTPRYVFEFGSAFDALMTEKDYKASDYDLQPFQFAQMDKMRELLIEEMPNLFGVNSSVTFQKEYYENLETPYGTIQAKCKTDIEQLYFNHSFEYNGDVSFMPPTKQVFDLKTTTCKTLREFMSKIFVYSYDRAGAWYLDVSKADFYSLRVCNYTNKEQEVNDFQHQVWQIDFTPQMLEIGRGEYQRILKYAIDNGLVKII